MPAFSGFQVAPVPLNPLFDIATADKANLDNKLGEQALIGKTLQNDYTRQVQPGQINMLLRGQQAYGDALNALQGPAPTDATQASTPQPASGGLTVQRTQPGQSLLVGETPRSLDSGFQDFVGQTASNLGVNPQWAQRVQYAEAGSFKDAMAAKSSAGALGGMQLMPGTAKELGLDPTDRTQNAQAGVTYLKKMKDEFGDPVLATAAYNAGPQRVHDWLAGKATLPTETIGYVSKVFGTPNALPLLNNAVAGANGHPVGLAGAGTGEGLQSVAMDDRARSAVRLMLAEKQMALGQPDGKGMAHAAAIQKSIDKIAGEGSVVDQSGNVYIVPGALRSRYADAQATAAGKVAPETQLADNKGVIDQRTHAGNAAVDQRLKLTAPVTLSPGQTLTTPATVGVGVTPSPGGPTIPAGGAASAPGTYQAPQPTGGPFLGTGMDPQVENILIKGDPGSPEYAAAYAQKGAEKVLQDGTRIRPDMTPYRTPTFQPPGAPAPSAVPVVSPTSAASQPAGAAPTAEAPVGGANYGKATVVDGGKMNDGQSNAATFSERMTAAERNFQDPKIVDALLSPGQAVLSGGDSKLGGSIGNMLISPEKQVAIQAEKNFITAILRKESGASISPGEFADARRVYIPQPNDSPAVLAQKSEARRIAITGMQRAAGPTYKAAPAAPTPSAQPPAAPAPAPAPAYRENQTATGPNGARMIFRNGAWAPL